MCKGLQQNTGNSALPIMLLITWLHLSLRAGDMYQILCCDWLPKQTRWAILSTWDYLLLSGQMTR